MQFRFALVLVLSSISLAQQAYRAQPGQSLPRLGDEIIVCGQLFHTSAPVILWLDPGGYDASRPPSSARRIRAGAVSREITLTDEELDHVHAGGWTIDLLRDKIDQFVIHYDVAGVSR